jgi:hypothetical protein
MTWYLVQIFLQIIAGSRRMRSGGAEIVIALSKIIHSLF